MFREYNVVLFGKTYKYRAATRAEIEESLKFEFQVEMEDYVCKQCVISPVDIDWANILAGIPSALAELILDVSGVTAASQDKLQKDTNEWIKTDAGKLEILMMSVFHMRLSEIQALDPVEWYKTASAAQIMATSMYGINLEEFMKFDPTAPVVKKKRPSTSSGSALHAQIQNKVESGKHPPMASR